MAKLAEVGFTQSYTYFTWRNDQVGAARTTWRSSPRGPRPTTCAPTSGPTRPTSSPARCATAPPAAFRLRLVLAATLVPVLRHLQRLRAVRERAGVGRQRGVPALREVRDQAPRLGRPRLAGAVRHPAQRHPPPPPAFAELRNIRFHGTFNDAHPRLLQAQRRRVRHRARRRQPRPRQPPTRTRVGLDLDALGLPVHRPFEAHDELTGADLHLAGPERLRPPRPGRRARPRPHTCAGARDAQPRSRPLSRGRRPLVPAGRLLRGPRPGLLRRQRRRHRRPAGASPRSSTTSSGWASTASGCCPSTSRPCATAATTSPTSSPSCPSTATWPTLVRAGRGGPPAGHPGHRRPGHEPHQRPAPVVPGVPPGPHQPQGRLVRVERRRPALARGPHHLRRHRAVELDLGPAAPAVLLAPVLQPPARPQLRQPRGPGRPCSTSSASGSTSASTASASTPCPTCSSGTAPTARTCPRPTSTCKRLRKEVDADPPRHGAAGRGQPVAGRRRRLLRRRRRVPHVLPLPAHAPHVHGRAAGAALPDHRDPGPDARHPRRLPSGASSCATTTS